MIEFTLYMKALPKGRPRASKGGVMYTPQRTRDYEEAVRNAVLFQLPEGFSLYTKPLRLTIKTQDQVPKSWSRAKKVTALSGLIYPNRGDLDNRVKAISDALNGVLYLDDAQIVSGRNDMYYGDTDMIYIKVEDMLEKGSGYERDNQGSA